MKTSSQALRLTVIAASIMQMCAANAATPPATGVIDAGEVVVQGQRASIRRALAEQEKANHIVSVISSDDIGGLPDKNAAEALARAPGVSVQRDQGEGRYVTVRGLGPDYNAISINGATTPSPESGRRAVALDVLPAGMIRSLAVSKTTMPEHAAGSLGGAVEVKTLGAFDLPRSALAAQAAIGHDGNTGKRSPSGNLLWADRFADGKAGIAFGASTERRSFGSENVETGGAWKDGKVGGVEYRDYLPVRERRALALNLDYRPEARNAWYLRSFVSRFSDDEVRDRLTVSNISGGAATPGVATPGEPFTARIERRLRQRKFTQQITSTVAGAELDQGDWNVAFSLGASSADEDTPESINDARFRNASNFTGLTLTGTQIPRLSGPAELGNPARYNLNGVVLQARASTDKERHARADLARTFDTVIVKGGFKLVRRNKRNDTEQWSFSASRVGTGSYFGAAPDYAFLDFGNSINPQAIRDKIAPLDRTSARLANESALNDYAMKEDIDAAYLQASFTQGDWYVLGGMRHERTSFDAQGNQVAAAGTSALVRENRYGNTLPAIQARYELDRNTSVRAALTRSLVRPNFSQLAPGVSLPSPTEAVIGNPYLQPLRSNNADIGVERITGSEGAWSVYAFHKRIKDFSYTTDLAGSGAWTGYTSAVSYANGGPARASGLELAWNQTLGKGFLLGANMTLTSSSAEIGRFDKASSGTLTRTIRLPGQSRQVANLLLGYESGPISTRLAINHKSPYLLEVGSNLLDATQDRIVDTQSQLDFSFAWRINQQVQVVFDAANLNNEKYYVYQGSRAFNAQYEQYGRTYKITVKMANFK